MAITLVRKKVAEQPKPESKPVQSIAKTPEGVAKPTKGKTALQILKEMSGKTVKRTVYDSKGKPKALFNAETPTVEGELMVSVNNMTFTYTNSSGTKVVGSGHMEFAKVEEGGVSFPAYDGHRVLYHW